MTSSTFRPMIPYPIFGKGVRRSKGVTALKGNIAVTRAITEIIKTTLGPKGYSKILYTPKGELVITNDSATILKKMDIFFFDHPISNILIEVAKTQERMIGDGTTTAVILAGELAVKAEKLLDQKIHPNIIIKGYKRALDIAVDYLQKISSIINPENNNLILNIVTTSLQGRNLGHFAPYIAKLVMEAVTYISEKRNIPGTGEQLYFDIDNIKIVKAIGGSLPESELVKGVIIDEEVVHPLMPRRIVNARIALIYEPLELRRRKDQRTFLTSYHIEIGAQAKIKSFKEEEAKIVQEKIEKIIEVGANVVLTPKHIDEIAQYYLAKANILAVKRVRTTDMKLLTKVTGGKLVATLDDLSSKDLGYAGIVEERKIGDNKFVFVYECDYRGAASVLLRGNSDRLLDEAEREVNNAIMNLITFFKDTRVVPGGGATEMALSYAVRSVATRYPGKEQLAMLAFAEALESIPLTLAENAGIDKVDVITELRPLHEEGKHQYGIEVISGKVKNMFEAGIIEPLQLKEHALKIAVEAASIILRINDILVAPQKKP